jgi:hypothetical protein
MHIPLPTSSLAPVSKSNKVVTVMYSWTRVYLMDSARFWSQQDSACIAPLCSSSEKTGLAAVRFTSVLSIQTHGLADCGRSGNGKMNSKKSTLQRLAPLCFQSSLKLGLNRALLKRQITEIGVDSD